METSVPTINSLDEFVFERVLSKDTNSKTCSLLMKTKKDGLQAVILIEKAPFSDCDFGPLLEGQLQLDRVFQNDIYSQHIANLPLPYAQAKFTIICPCTEKHIRKYSKQEVYCIRESPADYINVTEPFLQKHQFDMKWVHNILEGKAEVDRVLYNDPDPNSGFMLLPDLKWDQSQLENLYVTGLIRQPIRSMRELRSCHLPLLKKLATKGKEVVRTKYGVRPCQLRVYFHYQPTYYHLHVHYTHMCYWDHGCSPERAHLVEDVIDNIERDSDHYVKCSLTFLAKELDLLTEEYMKHKPEFFQ